MWQHRHYMKLVIVMNIGLPLLLGVVFGDIVGMLLLAGLLRLVLSQHFTFFINSLAHIWGSRPYTEKNTARDNAVLALFTYGEGYHNFHHIFASDYRNGIRWWHYDPTKWMIRTFAFLGLAKKLKRTPVERIEQAKAQTLLLKTQVTIAAKDSAHEKLALLQSEYDMLLKKLQHFCYVQKQVIEAKKNSMLQQCEKSALMKQYHELESAWQLQKQAWLELNSRLRKARC